MRLKLQAAGLLRNGPPTSLLNFCGPSPRLLSLKYLQTTSLIIFSTTSLFQYPCPSGFAGIISGGSESRPIFWPRRRKSIRRKSFSGKNLRDWARRNTGGGAARVPFQKGTAPVVSAFRLNFSRNLCGHCCQLNGRNMRRSTRAVDMASGRRRVQIRGGPETSPYRGKWNLRGEIVEYGRKGIIRAGGASAHGHLRRSPGDPGRRSLPPWPRLISPPHPCCRH